jgi:hypothetical protein
MGHGKLFVTVRDSSPWEGASDERFGQAQKP